MTDQNSYLTLTLNLAEPVEAGDLGKMFEALSKEFEDSLEGNNPDLVGQAKIYIKEIRKGSIIIDLLPLIRDAIGVMKDAKVISDFSVLLQNRLKPLFSGKPSGLKTKGDLITVANLIRAVANDQNGNATLESATFKQGVFRKQLDIKFDTRQARTAISTVEREILLIEQTTGQPYERVTMVFVRSSITDSDLGKRSGELVIVEVISRRGLPLIYASELAEQKIKHEIRESDENIFKKAFVVDVNVELRGGKEIAYRVSHVHQVFDLPD